MVRLAILLIGTQAVKRQWRLLPLLGALWIALGALVFLDVSSGALAIATDVLGGLFVVESVLVLASVWASSRRAKAPLVARALAFLLFGLMIMDVPFDHGISDSVLFGLVFSADGLLRIASAWVVRFRRWPVAIFAACIEIVLAVLILTDWPWPHRYVIPYCMSVALIISGLTLVRLGLQLRNLPAGASITELPMFQSRPWHSRGVLRDGEQRVGEGELTLYVWTATGSIESPVPRPVVNRYIAAVDRNGVVSTGHAALELHPDVYISLYPAVDIDHSPDDFARLLRAGTENDVPGRWNETHEIEVANWRAPDRRVKFRRYNEASLRRFWLDYRQDSTYNLTSRSCSTAASLALECALEGSVGHRHPWRAFFLLLLDPYLWLAAMLRHRGVTMAWTPGLVLDYGRALKRVVEREHLGRTNRLPLRLRLQGALRQRGARAA
ncbi:hypothetical protein [Lysobacter sp. FW306-1B-D06B]|uniref:HdeD family acid-resistance protein n=1 Tax=Lysobacter sp. FW306-1B-D06B TaxID=3140250 RepID=UPI00313FF608